MLGYRATRLEGMKSTSPLRCLLVKLNCTCVGNKWFDDKFLVRKTLIQTRFREEASPVLRHAHFAALNHRWQFEKFFLLSNNLLSNPWSKSRVFFHRWFLHWGFDQMALTKRLHLSHKQSDQLSPPPNTPHQVQAVLWSQTYEGS